MKQTAVEFLEKELNELLLLFSDKWDKVNKAIEQAKEMEKQQQDDLAIGFGACLIELLTETMIAKQKMKELLEIYKK